MARVNDLLVLLLLALLLSLLPSAASIAEPELDAALAALRARGYNLFSNAITTSDLLFELLRANASFTLFAPTDAALFALDMNLPAPSYLRTLRYHVARGLLDLRDFRDGAAFPTLLPQRDLPTARRRSLDAEIVTAGGVDVVLPGIFYGREVAVHGLGGIISFKRHHPYHHCEPVSPPVSPLPPSDFHHPPSGLPDFHHPPSGSPDLRHPPSEPPEFYHTPSESPDPSLPPARSVDPPDSRAPAWSPTLVPAPMAPAWSPATDLHPDRPAPSPGFISPAMAVEAPDGLAPTAAFGRGASQIGFPGGNLPREMAVPVGGAAPPRLEQGFSRGGSGGACLSSEAVGCAQMAGFDHVVGHLGRPRQHPRDDSL